MANFAPMIAGALASQATDQAQKTPPDGRVPSSRYAASGQNDAQQPTTLNAVAQPAQSTGFMDMLASANMQGQQDLGRVKQMQQSRQQPMNDQNSWWSMYR